MMKISHPSHQSGEITSLSMMMKVLQSTNSMYHWKDGQILSCDVPDLRLCHISARSMENHFMMPLLSKQSADSKNLIPNNESSMEQTKSSKRMKFQWPPQILCDSPIYDRERREEREKGKVCSKRFHSIIHDLYVERYKFCSKSLTSDKDYRSLRNNAIDSYLSLRKPTEPIQIIRKQSSTLTSSSKSQPNTKFSSSRHDPRFELSGYDLIIPYGWGREFLRLAVSHGALVAGFEDLEYLQCAAGIPSFPRDFVETEAGIQYWEARASDSIKIEQKRPKSKRRMFNYDLVSKFVSEVTKRYAAGPAVDTLTGDIDSGQTEGVRERIVDEMVQDSTLHENSDGTDQYANIVCVRNAVYLDAFEMSKYIVDCRSRESDDQSLKELIGECIPELPSLTFPTLVPVRIHPTGRGIPQDGDLLVIPEDIIYDMWNEHHMNRCCEHITGNKRKRLGEWRGLKIDSERFTNPDRSIPKNTVGVVTSGRNKKLVRNPGHSLVAMGLCDASFLYNSQRNAVLHQVNASTLKDSLSTDYLLKSRSYALVLFYNQSSKWLRPALLKILI